MHYKTIVLNSRPLTDIEPDTFRTETRPRSELKPGKGEALVQCTWLSLDPAMRGYIRDTRSYLPPVKIGEVCYILVGGICAMGVDISIILLQVMRAAGLGVVVRVGPGSMFNVGDRVKGSWGVFPFLFFFTLLYYFILFVFQVWLNTLLWKTEIWRRLCMSSFVCQLESSLHTYPTIIKSVYRMVSNLSISWAHLDCQVSSRIFIVTSYLTSHIFNRSDCLLRTTLFSCNSLGCFWISPVGPRENWPPKTWRSSSCLRCRRLRWFRRLSAWQSHGG